MSTDYDPSLDHERIRRSFHRSLGSYHQAANVQAMIAEQLVALLRKAGAPTHCPTALEFGCCTGFLTRALIRDFRFGQFYANDLVSESETFIAPLLDGVVPWRFLGGSIEKTALPASLDLVASSSTVQWVFDPAALLRRLETSLNAGGFLAMSGFGHGHFVELQALGSTAMAKAYHNAADWPALLPPNMDIVTLLQEEHVIHFDDLRHLLDHLRRTGVNANAGTVWTRARLKTFEAAYRARFEEAAGLRLTYQPVYLIAQKRA